MIEEEKNFVLWDTIEIEYVAKTCKRNIDYISNYHDSILKIYKVPIKFPTGFIFQQVVEVQQSAISGPAKSV